MYCKVSIDIKSKISNNEYTYIVPPMYEFLKEELIGVRVLVEFGFQKVLGYIVEVCEEADIDSSIKHIKPLYEVLDAQSEITSEQIELAKFISDDAFCQTSQALNLMVPSFLRSKFRKVLNVINYDKIDLRLSNILDGKTKVVLDNKLLESYNLIKQEMKKGNIEISYDTYSYGVNKKVKEYYVNSEYDKKYIISSKRLDIVNYLSNNSFKTINEICDTCNCSIALVRELESKKVLLTKTSLVSRGYKLEKPLIKAEGFSIIPGQVVSKYYESSKKRFLLFTNDDDFKFKFLANSIISEVRSGKKVFIVTPTITAYVKTKKLLQPYISDLRVLAFSSRLTNDEYYQNYQTLKANDYDVVITSKIGLFLPLNNLGLVVMIDSDNYNYISEQTPKYDSHSVLEKRCSYFNSKLMLVSSAPTIEEYYGVHKNQSTLLKYIVNNKNSVNLIDQRKYDAIFSPEVLKSIETSLENNKKICVITNHSGYATSLVCRSCGEVVRCAKCHSPLSFFASRNVLKCNHCDTKYEFSKICPKCKSDKVELYGTGIEKLREYLAINFPKYNVVCIDKEVTNNQKSYLDLMMGLEDDKYQIFVGTSILLDLMKDNYFDTIVLLDSDGLLALSDYRSNYECFKLVSKVNSFKANKYICGIKINHYAIQDAINNDYHSFFTKELQVRELLNNPPLYFYSKLYISGEYKDMYYYANYFKKVLKSLLPDSSSLGPSYDYETKSVKLIIKYKDYQKLKYVIGEVNNKFKEKKLTVNFEKYPR